MRACSIVSDPHLILNPSKFNPSVSLCAGHFLRDFEGGMKTHDFVIISLLFRFKFYRLIFLLSIQTPRTRTAFKFSIIQLKSFCI